MTIPVDHWHDNGDGTAWMLLRRCPDPAAGSAAHWGGGHPCVYGCKALDRPCGTCEGDGGGHIATSLDGVEWPDCAACDGTGRHTFSVEVSFGPMTRGARIHRVHVVPGMVLPIVANSKDWEWGNTNHIDLMGSTAILRTNTEGFCQDDEIVTLPAAAKPGMWAVLLQLHGETS